MYGYSVMDLHSKIFGCMLQSISPIFFIFIQFLEKIGQTIGWRPQEVCTATLNDNTTKSCAVGCEYKSNHSFRFLKFFACLISCIFKFKTGKTSTPLNFYVFCGLPDIANERKEYFSVCEICWVSLATRLFNMAVDYFDAKKYACYSWVLFVRGT